MRNIILVSLSALAVSLSPAAVSAQTPNYDTCHALAQQRGSGHSAGTRAHEAFIRACLAGNVPFRGVAVAAATGGQWSELANYDSCHALADQRGSGHSAGRRAHEAFINACLAGKGPFDQAPVGAASAGQWSQWANYDSCHTLADQRGSGHTAGTRAHEAFIRACLAGRGPLLNHRLAQPYSA